MTSTTIASVHHAIIDGLLHRGACPSNSELAAALDVTEEQVESLLRELEAIHGVVLHPHVCAPWVIHPFSVTPTLHWIEGAGSSNRHVGCWAPCIWCAFGVAALVGGPVHIHTRIAAQAENLVIPVSEDGDPEDASLMVHFAIPPSKAWANVHQHCSLVLAFPSEHAIDDWCRKHNQPRGKAVPIRQAAKLGRHWYGTHASPDWRKWTVAEAQQIFHGAGLTDPFWDLGTPRDPAQRF